MSSKVANKDWGQPGKRDGDWSALVTRTLLSVRSPPLADTGLAAQNSVNTDSSALLGPRWKAHDEEDYESLHPEDPHRGPPGRWAGRAPTASLGWRQGGAGKNAFPNLGNGRTPGNGKKRFHRITECWGLAGPSVGPPAQPPAEAGSPRAGCTAPRPGGSGISPEKETPQPPWAAWARAPSRLGRLFYK